MPVVMRHMIYSDSMTINDSYLKLTFKGESDAQGLSSRAYKVNVIQVNLASTSDADTSTPCPKTSFCLGFWEVFKEFSATAFGFRLSRTQASRLLASEFRQTSNQLQLSGKWQCIIHNS